MAVKIYRLGVIQDAPACVLLRIGNAVPWETFVVNLVDWPDNPIADDRVQGDGGVYVSVPIPAGVAPGTHTLQVDFETSATASRNFQIVGYPLSPEPPEPNVPPTPVEGYRWALEDALVGSPSWLAPFTFPNNPASMTSPHPARALVAEAAVGPTGQPLLWEGALARPYLWQFSGYCGSQEFYDALLAYTRLRRRFYLTDHRGRTWVVSFEQFDALPRREISVDSDDFWVHDYTVHAIIYEGPVSP